MPLFTNLRDCLAAQPGGGLVKFIDFYPIAACVGDRWPSVFPKVDLMSQSIIRRDLAQEDLWLAWRERGFILVFTNPDMTHEAADARCLRLFEEIRIYLQGNQRVALPVFDADPSLLLEALDNGHPPALRLAARQPEGAWIPPGIPLATPAAPPEDDSALATLAQQRPGGEPQLRPLNYETRPQIQARYVTMGRFNTLFDAIDMEFRGFWAVAQKKLGLFLADPRLRALHDAERAATAVTGQILAARAKTVGAESALDLAVLDRTLAAISPRILAGATFSFVIPVSACILLRKEDRYAYFDRWAAAPPRVRQLGRFYCYTPTTTLGDQSLADIVTMLCQCSRLPIFKSPADPKNLQRLRGLRIEAVLCEADAPLPLLERACAAARQLALITHLARVVPQMRATQTRATLVSLHPHFIEGGRTAIARALPHQPLPLSRDRFCQDHFA